MQISLEGEGAELLGHPGVEDDLEQQVAEFLAQTIDGAARDRVGDLAGRGAATVGLHAVPEEGVVPDLGGVVVDAAAGFLDDLFEAHALEFGAFLQVVQVHHISVVVLAVVKLQGFLAVVRGQSVDRVRQCGQGVFHEYPRLKRESEKCEKEEQKRLQIIKDKLDKILLNK